MEAASDANTQQIKTWLGAGSINIFGMPFAGKDTHGHELSKLLQAPLIGGGAIIRDSGPQHMRDHIADGSLSPPDEYLQLILPYLSQDKFTGHPLILNSVGRWFGEHIPVREAAQSSHHPIKAVLHIEIGSEEFMQRWETSHHLKDRGKRHDDAKHALEKRLDEFNTKTVPVIDYYRDEGLLIEIDGRGSQTETLQKILQGLKYFIDESS